MGIITNTEGHSRPQEKKVANWLYMSIATAIILAAIAFMLIGRKTELNPTNLDHTPSSSDTTGAKSTSDQPNQTK